MDLLGSAVSNQIKRNQRTFKTVMDSYQTYRRVKDDTAKGLYSEPETPVKTRFNGNVSRYRSIGKHTISMKKIEQVLAAAPGITINEVILTTIGGALRKYLAAKDELPGIPLVGGVPHIKASQRDTKSPSISLMNIALGTDVANAKERLLAVQRANAQSKAYSSAVGSDIVSEITQNTPPIIASLLMKAYSGPLANSSVGTVNNTLISNVSGISVPLYLAGAQLIDILALGPLLPNMGLFHGISTVCDNVTITATGCRKMMPDPAFYAKCLNDSFNDLVKQTVPKKKPRKKKASA